jgi:hypothetical protein
MPENMPDVPIVTPVVKTAEETPTIAIHTAQDAAEIPPAALGEAFHTLASAINRLSDVTERTLEASKEVVTEPITDSTEQAEDIAPDVVPPKPDKYVRRNGRRVRRG